MPDPTPVDTGNPLLGPAPCQGWASLVRPPDGIQRIAFTARTPSTTLTVFLTAAEADAWIAVLAEARAGMSALVIPPNGARP